LGVKKELPFVFIGGLRRSGTTMMSEVLTEIPYAFIFREPGLARGTFNVKAGDATQFRALGTDLESFRRQEIRTSGNRLRRRLGLYRGQPVRQFRDHVLPQLLRIVQQIGVKEICHAGWHHYVRWFPDLRMIHIGRDPRDIYISLHSRFMRGKSGWKGSFTPKTVSRHLNREFSYLCSMEQSVESMRVRYEDVCQDEELLTEVMKFARSPIPGIGAVGGFLSTNEKRRSEHDLHGYAITDRRVARWRQSKDDTLVEAAHDCMHRMEGYCESWGYQ